jgi:rhodanese-related sulfurtransferase
MPTTIDRARLQELMKEGAQLVEVLARSEFDAEHLPGAISIPLRDLNRTTAAVLDKSKPVITYCYDYQ